MSAVLLLVHQFERGVSNIMSWAARAFNANRTSRLFPISNASLSCRFPHRIWAGSDGPVFKANFQTGKDSEDNYMHFFGPYRKLIPLNCQDAGGQISLSSVHSTGCLCTCPRAMSGLPLRCAITCVPRFPKAGVANTTVDFIGVLTASLAGPVHSTSAPQGSQASKFNEMSV